MVASSLWKIVWARGCPRFPEGSIYQFPRGRRSKEQRDELRANVILKAARAFEARWREEGFSYVIGRNYRDDKADLVA